MSDGHLLPPRGGVGCQSTSHRWWLTGGDPPIPRNLIAAGSPETAVLADAGGQSCSPAISLGHPRIVTSTPLRVYSRPFADSPPDLDIHECMRMNANADPAVAWRCAGSVERAMCSAGAPFSARIVRPERSVQSMAATSLSDPPIITANPIRVHSRPFADPPPGSGQPRMHANEREC